MSITVREALGLEIFNNARLVAGNSGADKKILYIDVLEVPDIDKWIRKNVLLMTTAFALKNNEEKLEELVKKLAKGGATALAIKPGRFIDEIPENLIRIANELQFPIIELPLDVAYTDIINSILSEVLDKQIYLLQKRDELHQRLTKTVLIGGGLKAVTETLAEVIKKPVLIENNNGDILAYSGSQDYDFFRVISMLEGQESESVLDSFEMESVRFIMTHHGNQVIAPIIVGGNLYGKLKILLDTEYDAEFIMVAAERSATVAALEITKEKAIFETEMRLQRDFIDELLSGKLANEDVLINRAKDFGWDINRAFIVLNFKIENIKNDISENKFKTEVQEIKPNIFNIIKMIMKKIEVNPILVYRNEGFVVLLDSEKYKCCEEANKYAKNMALLIKNSVENQYKNINLSIGMGRLSKKISDFNKSYEEANIALKIGRKVWGKGKIYHFEELGIYRLLFSHKDNEGLIAFYNEFIEPLVQYDIKHGTDLLHSLEQYYICNANSVTTAEKLYLHRNSLNYRLKRIKQILALDIDDPEIKLCLSVALKIKNLLDK